MVIIPSGVFKMGASHNEGISEQKPQHEVTIPKAFAMSRFEITFAEWDYCVSDGGCKRYKPFDEGWGRGSQPVINVSWNDAKRYVKWLSKKTAKTYRLPTESEWEYAVRAGTTSPYSWGKYITPRNANYDHYSSRTVSVDSYYANHFGLYNVHGNVWEHVEDCWHQNYVNHPADGSAWLRKNQGNCSFACCQGRSMAGAELQN